MPSITIGVHVQKGPERLRKTLAGLSKHVALPFELILLMDGPDENEFHRWDEFHGIPRSCTEDSRGAAACFNRLVSHRPSDLHVFIESGVEFGGPWLEPIVSAMDRYPGCGIAGPSTNRASNSQFVFSSTAESEEEIACAARRVGQLFGGACRLLDTRHDVSSFCYVVRGAVCQKIGEADESYAEGPHWVMDYNVRAHRAGFKSVWVCGAYAHRAPAARVSTEKEIASSEENQRRYQDKFCGLRLRGLKDDYLPACRGDACPNFAPADLIQNSVQTVAIDEWVALPDAAEVEPPLVSCIMPTHNRRHFIPRAIRCFERQDYPTLELLVVDDGTDPIEDILPKDSRIRYWHLPQKRSVGAKRNFACSEARGEYIAHWDDDDWYASSRISRQIAALRENDASICGSSTIYYYQVPAHKAFRYQCPAIPPPWLGPIAYRKFAWEENHFPAIPIAEDVKFLAKIPAQKRIDLKDPNLCVASIHPANASPKRPMGKYWLAEPMEKIRELLPPEDELLPRMETASTGREILRSKASSGKESLGAATVEMTEKPPESELSERAVTPAAPLLLETESAQEFRKGLSVVICHGGQERLPNLAASLVNLRQCRGIDETIVVEMGATPHATDVSRRWADKYFFVRNGAAFERSRCLNIGAALAEFDLVLWRDNDLMMPPSFVESALKEMRARQLDYLIPFISVDYLSAADSREVMSGAKKPSECRPVNILRENRGTAGIVKKSFLSQYGGLSEEFRGWGGEDDAWWIKASLLGKAGTTRNSGQRLYHLFHPNSGGYKGARQISGNPHYANNLTTLRKICAITNRDDFLRLQPPKLKQSCNWKGKRVLLVSGRSDRNSRIRADALARALHEFSLDEAEWNVATLADAFWREFPSGRDADCILLIGQDAAMEFLSNPAAERFWRKSIVNLPGGESTSDCIDVLRKIEAITTSDPIVRRTLQSAALETWPFGEPASSQNSIQSAARALLQPVSLVLSDAALATNASTDGRRPSTTHGEKTSSPMQLPIWIYWEGDCPEWIRLCHKTIFAHGRDVRLISPADFNRLWTTDRDINLARLYVAHRSDFIRAYLLAHFGGIWIDSDCILMRSLDPILVALHDFEFVAHRERSGAVTNDFIAARPGSGIASSFYRRICEILRTGRQLAWTAIGGEPLTALLATTKSPWYEIECELIQPICWSDPGAFHATNTPAGHELLFNPRAFCYMLSNGAVKQFQTRNPSKNLVAEDTFFRFLVNKALENGQPSSDVAPNSQKVAPKAQALPFCIEAVMELAPARVLDIGVGIGRWGLLVRDFYQKDYTTSAGAKGKVHLEGIQVCDENVADHLRLLYDDVRLANGDIGNQIGGSWNLAILDGTLENWPKQKGFEILGRAMDAADYVLVHNAFVPETDTVCSSDRSPWKLSDFLALEPLRYKVFHACLTGGNAAFVISRKDPARLKRAEPTESVFARMLKAYTQTGEESVSGPGSSLLQTKQIRERLPLLVEDIDARSLLDAPCGDFNWMKSVKLGITDYIGVDVLLELVTRNRQAFGDPRQKFLRLDLTRNAVPGMDLILCRDCLVHLSYEDIFRVLRNFKASKSKYLLTTTFVRVGANLDIPTGGWRPLNFQLPPFYFPAPLRIIDEKCTENGGRYSDKSLGLWRIEDVRI